MASSLLTHVQDVLALPNVSFSVDARGLRGLIWDPEREDIIAEALQPVFTISPRDVLKVDEASLRQEVRDSWDGAEIIETPTIYGGHLLRHFGHFIHECLSRLWWLAPAEAMEGPAKEASLQLQQIEGDVVFFMPKWIDPGKNLLPYMEEIFAMLGLPARRIRILQQPQRFRHLLIPACVWGFGTNSEEMDQRLGCDTRALMRHLLASSPPPSAGSSVAAHEPHPAEKVYVTRSSLPISLGRLIGDVVLDPLLAEAGYTVFHPERVPIADQIRVYAQAKDLIFMDGSSIYLLWFAKLRPGTRVRVILRRRQGRWMCDKVLELLPESAHIRWELVDGLRGEALTSDRDWESHNVADLATLQRQLGRDVPPVLPQPAENALAAYSQTLVQESTPEQLARVLQALLTALATSPQRPPTRRQRLYRKVRRLFTSP